MQRTDSENSSARSSRIKNYLAQCAQRLGIVAGRDDELLLARRRLLLSKHATKHCVKIFSIPLALLFLFKQVVVDCIVVASEVIALRTPHLPQCDCVGYRQPVIALLMPSPRI